MRNKGHKIVEEDTEDIRRESIILRDDRKEGKR